MRIVSLLPSATEIVCALGLLDSLVGVSHECDFPEQVQRIPRVTRSKITNQASSQEIDLMVREQLQSTLSLYDLDAAAIERLKPDLIITQSLCNVCAVAEPTVRAATCTLPYAPTILNLEPTTFDGVLQSIELVGHATDHSVRAHEVVSHLKDRVQQVESRSRQLPYETSVVLLEWIDPLFSAGHWVPELIRIAGGSERIGKTGHPSVPIDWTQLRSIDPDAILISCCGFDVDRTKEELSILRSLPGFDQLKCFRDKRLFVLDGNAYFSRPGPRLVDGLEILAHALHPNLHPLPVGFTPAWKMDF